MTRRRFEVLLSIGSNVDPNRNVPRIVAALDERFGSMHASAVFACPAVGAGGELDASLPAFLNLAVRCASDLPYRAMREACRGIERALGRRRTADPLAPRPADIDVVHGNEAFLATSGGVLPSSDLTVPHVLVPVCELAPDARARSGKTLVELRAALGPEARGMLRRLED